MKLKIDTVAVGKIFKKYGVKAAYIFGSFAQGKTHAKSDADLAVRFSKDLSFKKILALVNELTPFFPAPIDLVDLNNAPLPLQFRIYKDRQRIYAAKPKEEVFKQAKALSLYHDYKYYYDRFSKFEMDRILLHGLT